MTNVPLVLMAVTQLPPVPILKGLMNAHVQKLDTLVTDIPVPILTNVILEIMTVTPTPCVSTDQERGIASVTLDITELVPNVLTETSVTKCHVMETLLVVILSDHTIVTVMRVTRVPVSNVPNVQLTQPGPRKEIMLPL